MGLFDYLRYTAQANQTQPDMGTLQWGGATPTTTLQQPQNNSLSSFSHDSLEGYIASNLDYDNLRGGMWSDPNYGARGTVADMANYLRKAGFNSGADFQSFDPTKDPARWLSLSQVDGNNGWTRLIPNATGGRRFGNGFAGEGGTQYYVDYDPNEKKYKFSTKGIETSDKEAIMGALMSVGLVAGAAGIGGALGGAGTAGTTGTAGAVGSGAVGSGAGFVGEGALSGIGAWDAALAASPSWTAAGGMAGAAGVTDLGGGLSMGADGAITGATGLNPSTLSNAGLMESFGAGGGGVGGIGGAGGSGGGTPSTFNPAMDSQAANAAIEAGGGDALSGYTSAGVPSVTVNGAAGGAGTSMFDSLSNMGLKDWLGAGSTVLGAISGGQGQDASSSSTRSMDPRMDSLFYGDLAPRTQGLLGATVPGAVGAGQQLTAKGSGLLGQTAPNTATNPYATGILDDLQRRQQEVISRGLQQTKGNFQAYGGLGGSRQGVAEADAITRGADNFTGQAANFMGGLYNADQNRLRQDWTLGAGLVNQGINTPFLPAQNASQIYAPFTGFGTTTNNTQQGGGWQGAVGGALAGASFGRNMGWW